jgi:hypothetical protein
VTSLPLFVVAVVWLFVVLPLWIAFGPPPKDR